MIREVHMVNCQSWADSSFTLKDGINVLVADNNVGKSVFFKMLKITADPEKFGAAGRRALIRHGADAAFIEYTCDDGCCIVTQVEPTRVTYLVRETEDSEIYAMYRLSGELLKKLGLLTNDSDDGYVLNILDAEQDLLLVNSDLASNYKLIDMIITNPVLAGIKQDIQNNFSDIAASKRHIETHYGIYSSQLSGIKYTDLGQMKYKIDASKALGNLLATIDTMQVSPVSDFSGVETLYKLFSCCKRIGQVSDFTNLDSLMECSKKVNEIEKVSLPPELMVDLEPLIRVGESAKSLVPVKDFSSCDRISSLVEIASNWRLRELPDSSELCRMREEIEKNAKRCKCEIYGEVYYNGEECVPCGD